MTVPHLQVFALLVGLILGVQVADSTSLSAGTSLTDALRELQSRGLDLVFSNNVVASSMVVDTPPRATEPRQILEELLAPHGLTIREGVGGVLIVVPRGTEAGSSPTSSLTGIVLAGVDRAPLSGATLRLLPAELGTQTGDDGTFRFDNIPVGTFTIVTSVRGFIVERQEIEVVADRTTEVKLFLAPAPVTEDEIVVTPSKVSLLREQSARVFVLSRAELLALPHLGNDFFRALTLLPGVTANDVSAQFHVRGGRRDETQILLDGQELYDSYHLQDFDSALSVVTPDTISRVDLSTGGFPARYGDRMAGVLDMATASPTGSPRGRVALGILSAQAGGAGTFRQERGSWIAQTRRGTTDFAGRIFGTDAPRYWDAFGKLEYGLGERHRLRLNLLHTDDKYRVEETGIFRIKRIAPGSARSAPTPT